VHLDLTPRAFAHWDTGAKHWQVDAGDYTVSAGTSSRDLPLTATVHRSGAVVS
jgi:beta-glucosidase